MVTASDANPATTINKASAQPACHNIYFEPAFITYANILGLCC